VNERRQIIVSLCLGLFVVFGFLWLCTDFFGVRRTPREADYRIMRIAFNSSLPDPFRISRCYVQKPPIGLTLARPGEGLEALYELQIGRRAFREILGKVDHKAYDWPEMGRLSAEADLDVSLDPGVELRHLGEIRSGKVSGIVVIDSHYTASSAARTHVYTQEESSEELRLYVTTVSPFSLVWSKVVIYRSALAAGREPPRDLRGRPFHTANPIDRLRSSDLVRDGLRVIPSPQEDPGKASGGGVVHREDGG